MVQEISERAILHWNYRGFSALPVELWHYGGHVCELYLKYNNITELPDWLDRLVNLTNIYLQANYLTQLPDAISQLVHLETLDVSHNQLTSIPSSLGQLTNLRRIVLTQNRLAFLPDSIGQLRHLVSLQVSSNQLQTLPRSMVECRELQELALDLNRFRVLPSFLSRLPNLQSVSVCRNQLLFLPSLPFANVSRFLFDNNGQISHLPYHLACQLSRVPANPLVTRGVLYISSFGCFESHPVDHCLNLRLDATTQDRERCVHLPALQLNQSVPSLTELALRFIVRNLWNPLEVQSDPFRCLHRPKLGQKYVGHYDRWARRLSSCLPPSLVDVLRDGPTDFCLGCTVPVFRSAYPVFVDKILVQTHGQSNVVLRNVICCLLYCSPACFAKHSSNCRESWEVDLLHHNRSWSVM